MKFKSLFTSTVLCLAIMITGVRAGSAQEVQPLEPEWLLQMYAEGWTKVQDGVLQRGAEGGNETFTYGAEGYQWAKQVLERQVDALLSRYDTSPSDDLAELIDQLEERIARLEEGIASAPTAETFNGEALENCAPSWGGSAQAGPQSSTQGVTASAHAYFHNSCGYTANTFAMATAQAVAGTVETTQTQNDPQSGTWIESNASAKANGSAGCESSAQGTVDSLELNITYSTPYVVNYNCTLPIFAQDFESSTDVSNYFHATAPNSGQFNDISAEVDGGTWSIQQGRLQLVRTGLAGTENDAGITRYTNFPGPPSVLHITFDLGVSAWTTSPFQTGAIWLAVGRISAFTGYGGGEPSIDTFGGLAVNGKGGGKYVFSCAYVESAQYTADGTMHRISLFFNKSGAAANYRAPDGSLRTLRSNGVALWVDSDPVVVDAAAANGANSALTDLRMRFSNSENATWQFDNWAIRNSFPQ